MGILETDEIFSNALSSLAWPNTGTNCIIREGLGNIFVGGQGVPIGSFSSKTRTSLITQLLFYMFKSILIFQSFQSQKLDVLFCAVRPSKVYFLGCRFQNRTYNKSLETRKSFKVDFTL